MPNSDFIADLEILRGDLHGTLAKVHAEFADAQKQLHDADPADVEKKQKALASLKAAQALLSSTIAQATQVQTMGSEETGRAGYAVAVELMVTVKSLAATVGSVVTGLAAQPAGAAGVDERIAALSGVLEALAKLSPIALWQSRGASQG